MPSCHGLALTRRSCHRSHFGSRYTLGYAFLQAFFVVGSNPAGRRSRGAKSGRSRGPREMHWLSVGSAARDACCAARPLLGAKNVVSRHHARPARGGARSCPSAPAARRRAHAARRGQNMEHAISAARSLSGGARPRASGPITNAARSPPRRSATRLRPLASARGLAAKRPGASASAGLRERREITAF